MGSILFIRLEGIFGRVPIEKGVVSVWFNMFANKFGIVKGAYLQPANRWGMLVKRYRETINGAMIP